ncbi:MAG TPA: hypothetical protein VK541_14730 [Pedobacter sp.]|uniref:hypothetical protein n=1 Tax=Pedobacter sp. TaxID=1411316 RepID=UPI002CBF83F2|nr:hypothetical protein [Pedobacter sp.]HMI03736.1 hypothetical protein [Pedobacter sp.]
MITYSTVKSTLIEKGTRILKVLQFGAKTADECAPFGDDSNPIANMTAIYAETSTVDEQVIIGYINTKQLAAPGEKRLYSLKNDKSISFYVWLRNNGILELGGDDHNLVRFEPLNQGIAAANGEINTELQKIQTAIIGLGGAYTAGHISTDIDAAKINEIKCL